MSGSNWNIWDLHFHSPFSVLNNQFGNPNSDETWEKYISEIETKAKDGGIVAIGLTDYFSIEGYKKVIEYQKKGRLENIVFLPNIEFRVDSIIYREKEKIDSNGRRLNLHVLFSPDIAAKDIEEDFLQNLDFVYEDDPYEDAYKKKLTKRNLESFGKKLKEDQKEFRKHSDHYVGCMNVIVSAEQIKDMLLKRFKGNYIIVLDSQDLSLLDWAGQHHAKRKQLIQMSHAIFSSNKRDREFLLGQTHESIEAYIKEFIYTKPCLWGCDAHEYGERFLAPATNDEIRYCWIKAEPTWEGLMQTLYEPEERIKIQEKNPETSKSIYTLTSFENANTKINDHLELAETKQSLNPNLITIIGGRGAGKTALLDLISTTFREGKKLSEIETSFFYRLYANNENNAPIKTKVSFASGDEFEKLVGEDEQTFDRANIIYLTQNHFDEYSSNPDKLLDHIVDLVFERFSDKRREYQSLLGRIDTHSSEIQNFNLSIQHLIQEISTKDILQERLKNKEGENEDLDEKIKRVSADVEVKDEKVEESTGKIGDLRRQELLLDGLTLKLDDLQEETVNFEEYYSNQAKSLTEGLTTIFGADYPGLFDSELDDLKTLKNKISLNNPNIEGKKKDIAKQIAELETIIDTFKGENKILAELQQSKIIVLEELDDIKLSLDQIREKEEKIQLLENRRQESVLLSVEAVILARQFLQDMINIFEEGKNSILNNLDFEATVDIEVENLVSNLNDKLNSRSISENSIRGKIKPVMDELVNIANETVQDPELNLKEELKNWCNSKFFPVSKELIEKRKKSTSYSEYFNTILENILSVGISIKFNEKDLNKLSMGQRAIVLLKILLALDDKPLLIDQPEEHLDNRYVYSELTPAIRQAKKSRQIIIATHNANLVVNTDAEQIIISESINGKISYISTTLEDKSKRETITNILEGGEEAFSKREDRYGKRF